MIDFRLKEHRRSSFLDYYFLLLKTEEYDPWYYTANYLFNRYELNIEQRFWLSWLYGFIYNGASAWIVFNEFPDFKYVDFDRIKRFEEKYTKFIEFETDTRYKKGQIHLAFKSYFDLLKNQTQMEFFEKICSNKTNPRENFWKLWNIVRNKFNLFGRYSTFFYLETLMRCNKLNIEFDSLFLRDSGSKSHRNGLCYVLGKDEWDLHHSNSSFKGYTKEMLDWLEVEGDKLLIEAKEKFSGHGIDHLVDYATLETALCAYKGFYRRRRYFGYYLDRDAKQIKNASENGWYGIDWDVFWQCRAENLDSKMLCENKGRYAPSEEYQNIFMDKGIMINMDMYFEKYKYNDGYIFKLF